MEEGGGSVEVIRSCRRLQVLGQSGGDEQETAALEAERGGVEVDLRLG